MSLAKDIWAVVPVKKFDGAKQRLSGGLSPGHRVGLAAAMVADVLGVLARCPGLSGVLVVTVEPVAIALAGALGMRVTDAGALDGHTGAVMGGMGVLRREGRAGMMTVPGDIPCIDVAEVEAVLAAHGVAPAFTIVPAHDDKGSNCIVCSPPGAVPLRFGDDSFFPHLAAARHAGVEPLVVRAAGIGMDVDHPGDLEMALRGRVGARTLRFVRGTLGRYLEQ